MNLGNYKGGIMVDPNKVSLKSCKDTVVKSTARKYVSKAKSFQVLNCNLYILGI